MSSPPAGRACFFCVWCSQGFCLRVAALFVHKKSFAEQTWTRERTPGKLPMSSIGEEQRIFLCTCLFFVSIPAVCKRQELSHRAKKFSRSSKTTISLNFYGPPGELFSKRVYWIVFLAVRDLCPVHKEVWGSPVLFEKRRRGLKRKTYTDAFFMLCYMLVVLKSIDVNAWKKFQAASLCTREKAGTYCWTILVMF